MKLAFCLFHYFPYGGLQRDFLRIARLCYARGHTIHVYTMAWVGETEPGWHIHFIKVPGLQNHARCHAFTKQLQNRLNQEKYDCIVGFNKMPGLDWYYAADVCYVARIASDRPRWYRLLPRYRTWAALENAVFAHDIQTKIMLIAPSQKKIFQQHYQTETARFHELPPGIAKNVIVPLDRLTIRNTLRQTYRIPTHHCLLLMVGSGFKTKGLDRILFSLAALPTHLQSQCHLLVIGDDNKNAYVKLAKQLKIERLVQFLGGRSDVPQWLLAGDVLLHPAYHENTGTVLLEALAAGLPVLSVDICGYANYIVEAQAGFILPEPFKQAEWNQVLKNVLLSDKQRDEWRQNGLKFAQSADIYSLAEQAVTLIESTTH
ncbi:MAG: hypothetical protein A3F43_04440 [Gammaproteobacteria bacterium RIFCSPHIGHO2_12_FULL_42_10]|nr:MAG: hypothetical protein A3F43_04440 [Gammaproteobacteria bacterium RIFCSPHIGHO2_12_FULL_42_10]